MAQLMTGKPVTSWRRNQVLVTAACWLAFAALCFASPQSRELVRQGAADLANQRYEDALRKFTAAAETDAADAEAMFFQGVALNRLVRHAEALRHLEKSEAMGGRHPDVAFEKGWSLLGLKRWREAIKQLEEYDKAHTGRGQTSEFLGRAYLGLGEIEKAEAALKEALRRDSDLKPTVQLSLALLEQERSRPSEARQQLEGLLREAPESLVGRALRSRIERLTLQPEKPWQLTLSGAGGYNNNVTGVGDTSLLPSDIAGQASAFARFTLDGTYAWRLSRADSVAVGYGFLSDTYAELPQFDLIDHFWRVQLRVGYFHTWNQADGDDFDYETDGVFGAVSLRLFAKLNADMAYTRTFDRYQNPNSLAGPMGFAFARQDDVDLFSTQLSRPITKRLRAYARYDFYRATSNVTFYKYDQHIWSGGVILQF